MKDLNQLLLNFDYKQNFKDNDFYVSKSNYFAFNIINSWPKWEKNFLNICGDKYSGKSHLINIFLKKFKGIIIDADSFENDHLKKIKSHENIVLENLTEETDETLIHHLAPQSVQLNNFLFLISNHLT